MATLSSSQQYRTAMAIVAAMNDVDPQTAVSYRSPTCLRTIHPLSLGLPPQSNETYLRSLQSMSTVFENFTLTITDIVEDLPNRKICMWASARGDTAAGEYVNEYVWKLEFSEDGKQVISWAEFVDVGVFRDFHGRLQEAIKKKREAEKA